MSNDTDLAVIKVGGSLYTLPDLHERLHQWLKAQSYSQMLLVPGGGAMAQVVRQWDVTHRLGEERAHWLALRTVSLNMHFLLELFPKAQCCSCPTEMMGSSDRLWILDAFRFTQQDDANPGAIPHHWDATSDTLSARVAQVFNAQALILLKSVSKPTEMSWDQASEMGIVDPLFAEQVNNEIFQIKVVKLQNN